MKNSNTNNTDDEPLILEVGDKVVISNSTNADDSWLGKIGHIKKINANDLKLQIYFGKSDRKISKWFYYTEITKVQ